MNEWMNESINQWSLPTSSSNNPPNVTVFVSLWNQTLATVSCTFSRPHLPKALQTWQFFTFFFNVKSNSGYSLVHIWPAHLPKVLRPQFFTIFMWNRALATVSCTQFVDHFCRSRPETAETETLFRRPREPRPRVLSRCDDVVDMMAWWCGCHDGENAGHDNRP